MGSILQLYLDRVKVGSRSDGFVRYRLDTLDLFANCLLDLLLGGAAGHVERSFEMRITMSDCEYLPLGEEVVVVEKFVKGR